MPRRTPDQGVKPFEYRTGIGDLPTLGGMYRAGDPATIPPFKHHLLINMRIRPGGMITRPGMEEVYDTGVEECIDGLTEVPGLGSGALVLYPGGLEVDPPPYPPTPKMNAATWRLIFPSTSLTSDELVFVLPEPAAATPDTLSAIQSGTIMFNGMACAWVEYAEGWALVQLPFPPRSFKKAHDCLRATDRWTVTYPCPLESYEVDPSGFFRTNLWPGSHPVTAVRAVFWPKNPWTSGNWQPELTVGIPERYDSLMTGEIGVKETLYFIANNTTLGQKKVIRWDGVTQVTEYSIPAGYTVATMGRQMYGPFIVGRPSSPGTGRGWEYAAVRGADGTWTVLTKGVQFDAPAIFTVGELDYFDGVYPLESLNGNATVMVSGAWESGVFGDHWTGCWVFEHDPATSSFTKLVATLCAHDGFPRHVVSGAASFRGRFYAVVENDAVDYFEAHLVNGPRDPSAARNAPSYDVHSEHITPWAGEGKRRWIKRCGTSIYFGGQFGSGLGHSVFNAAQGEYGQVYQQYAGSIEKSELAATYSTGCLETIPHETVDEGYGSDFQPATIGAV